MNKKRTKLSIIMSVYNGEKFISETINSIISQSFKEWELVILDNCSNDQTIDILKTYENIKKIKVCREEKKLPRTMALNAVYRNISNETLFVMNMDSDDKLEKNWSRKAISCLESNLNIDCIAGSAKIINEEGKVGEIFKAMKSSGEINHLFSYTFPIVHSSTIFRRSCLNELSPYNERIIIGQDWDLCIRLMAKYKLYYLNHPAVYWRRYSSSITGKIENHLQGRLDKIYNIKQGYRFANNFTPIVKNRSRMGIENLALSILYFKKRDYKKFFIRFLLSLLQNPLALFFNNRTLKMFGIKKEFYF